MPAAQNKIITKLRERRQIEAHLRHMLTASSELEFRRLAQQIASQGSQVIPVIVGNLDQADARLLAAMGTVATLLDPDEVVTALRQAVLQPQRTDRGRIGAMTILERFLGQSPDDDLLASLRDPEGVAISSLEEVLRRAEDSPTILIEYVQGLDRQEPDVVLTVVRALREQSNRQAVEPLRMMAQDVREEIAEEALRALGSIRLPEAGRALQTLVPITAPALRPLTERLVRKLQFAGVEVGTLPPPDVGWRALVSPMDGLGQQSVWFVQEDRWRAQVQLLNVLLSDRAGAVEAVGHRQVSPVALPPRRLQGYVHDIALPDGSGVMLLLETSFDLGRRLVVEALAHNCKTQIPVAGVLRLLSPWLWGYGGADSLPPRALPGLGVDDESLLVLSDRLLVHPAFATWTVRSAETFQVAGELLRHQGWEPEMWVKRLAAELFADPAVAQVFGRRLEAMSEWLLLAGEEFNARLALVASRAIQGGTPQDQPFVRALVRKDLELALYSLRAQ